MDTLFGRIREAVPQNQKTMRSVERALNWYNEIKPLLSNWSLVSRAGEQVLQMTFEGKCVELRPLEAAKLDLGIRVRVPTHHVPIYVDEKRVCIQRNHSANPTVHVDLVWSLAMFMNQPAISCAMLPLPLQRAIKGIPVVARYPQFPAWIQYDQDAWDFVEGIDPVTVSEYLYALRTLDYPLTAVKISIDTLRLPMVQQQHRRMVFETLRRYHEHIPLTTYHEMLNMYSTEERAFAIEFYPIEEEDACWGAMMNIIHQMVLTVPELLDPIKVKALEKCMSTAFVQRCIQWFNTRTNNLDFCTELYLTAMMSRHMDVDEVLQPLLAKASELQQMEVLAYIHARGTWILPYIEYANDLKVKAYEKAKRKALFQSSGFDIVPFIMDVYEDSTCEAKVLLMDEFAGSEDPRIVAMIAEWCRHEFLFVRKRAFAFIAQCSSHDVDDLLLEGVNDSSPSIRKFCLGQLAKRGYDS